MTAERRRPIRELMQKAFPGLPVFFGFDFIPELQKCIASGERFIYADHAYFKRGYENGNFRVIDSAIHQKKLKDVEDPRFSLKPMEWRRGRHILVFPPSLTIARTFDSKSWTDATVKALEQHTDRSVIIKYKEANHPLSHFLHDCHAVVGYGTVASVEAAMHGVPVFSGPQCPATPIGLQDLSKIEDPIYPHRDRWLATLTYSQFHLDEIKSGYCREILNGLG